MILLGLNLEFFGLMIELEMLHFEVVESEMLVCFGQVVVTLTFLQFLKCHLTRI